MSKNFSRYVLFPPLALLAVGLPARQHHSGFGEDERHDPELTTRMVPTLDWAAAESNLVVGSRVMASEDFSFFQEKIPGLYFSLGVNKPGVAPGEAAPNHSPYFYVNDDALIVGCPGHGRPCDGLPRGSLSRNHDCQPGHEPDRGPGQQPHEGGRVTVARVQDPGSGLERQTGQQAPGKEHRQARLPPTAGSTLDGGRSAEQRGQRNHCCGHRDAIRVSEERSAGVCPTDTRHHAAVGESQYDHQEAEIGRHQV